MVFVVLTLSILSVLLGLCIIVPFALEHLRALRCCPSKLGDYLVMKWRWQK